MTTTKQKTIVSPEQYVAKCNQILEDKTLGELEKMMQLMTYAESVRIATEIEMLFNDFLHSKKG